MHIRSMLSIARKDALDIVLNRGTLMILLTPIITGVVFLFVGYFFGNPPVKILVYDPGNSGVAQAVGADFLNPQVVKADSAHTVSAAFGPNGTKKTVNYFMGLIVPADFASSLHEGQHPRVQVFFDENKVGKPQQKAALSLIDNYANSLINPQPVQIVQATINPSTAADIVNLQQFYLTAALVVSLGVGISLVPSMLIEEKEKKTIRMLMVSPASFLDIVIGKLLVGLFYQCVVTLFVLTIMGGFIGNVPLVLFFVLLGATFTQTLGLLVGSWFKTSSALGTFGSIAGTLFIIPVFFSGQIGQLISDNTLIQIIKLVPTFFLADGFYHLFNDQLTGDAVRDIVVIAALTVILTIAAVISLRRQMSVTAAM